MSEQIAFNEDEFDYGDRNSNDSVTEEVEHSVSGLDKPVDEIELPQLLKNLFLFIDEYQPRERKMGVPLMPFVPDYVPAFGNVDDFIKVVRPDHKPEPLGAKTLDEPCIDQSNPAILELQLRPYFDFETNNSSAKIDEDDERKQTKIDQWIDSAEEIHSQETRIEIRYSHPMPVIDGLMEPWTEEMADRLASTDFTDGKEYEIDFETLTKLLCNLLQIPVYDGHFKDSLHVLFSLLIDLRETSYSPL